MEHDKAREDLRKKYLEEAKESIRHIEDQQDIIAAILTGSAAWGKPNPDGDLDILLIARNRNGVLYRYLIPRYYPVPRRTELGYIPIDVVNKNIGDGYRTPISCSMIEQLKNGRVLYQKDAQGDDIIESCRNVLPSKLVIGELISGIGKVLRESEEHLDRGRVKDAILTIRQVAGLSVRALLLAREKTGIAKEKHEYRAVKKHLSGRETASYEQLSGVAGTTAQGAHGITTKAVDLMKWVLKERYISPALVDYDREKPGTERNPR